MSTLWRLVSSFIQPDNSLYVLRVWLNNHANNNIEETLQPVIRKEHWTRHIRKHPIRWYLFSRHNNLIRLVHPRKGRIACESCSQHQTYVACYCLVCSNCSTPWKLNDALFHTEFQLFCILSNHPISSWRHLVKLIAASHWLKFCEKKQLFLQLINWIIDWNFSQF